MDPLSAGKRLWFSAKPAKAFPRPNPEPIPTQPMGLPRENPTQLTAHGPRLSGMLPKAIWLPCRNRMHPLPRVSALPRLCAYPTGDVYPTEASYPTQPSYPAKPCGYPTEGTYPTETEWIPCRARLPALPSLPTLPRPRASLPSPSTYPAGTFAYPAEALAYPTEKAHPAEPYTYPAEPLAYPTGIFPTLPSPYTYPAGTFAWPAEIPRRRRGPPPRTPRLGFWRCRRRCRRRRRRGRLEFFRACGSGILSGLIFRALRRVSNSFRIPRHPKVRYPAERAYPTGVTYPAEDASPAGMPTLPKLPALRRLPTLPKLPTLKRLPTLPRLHTLPKLPTLRGLHTLPRMPTLPKVPTLPRAPSPRRVPTLPRAPPLRGVPTLGSVTTLPRYIPYPSPVAFPTKTKCPYHRHRFPCRDQVPTLPSRFTPPHPAEATTEETPTSLPAACSHPSSPPVVGPRRRAGRSALGVGLTRRQIEHTELFLELQSGDLAGAVRRPSFGPRVVGLFWLPCRDNFI